MTTGSSVVASNALLAEAASTELSDDIIDDAAEAALEAAPERITDVGVTVTGAVNVALRPGKNGTVIVVTMPGLE